MSAKRTARRGAAGEAKVADSNTVCTSDSNTTLQPDESHQPGLPPLSEGDMLRTELRRLAETAPDDIDTEIALKRLAKTHELGLKLVRTEYSTVRNQLAFEREPAPLAVPLTPEELSAIESAQRRAEQDAAELSSEVESLWSAPDKFSVWRDDFSLTAYVAEGELVDSILLAFAARLFAKSSGWLVVGLSASGKSELVFIAATFLPSDLVLYFTSMSKQALNYLGSVQGKVIVLGEFFPEREGEDDTGQTYIRQLLSEGRITRLVVEKTDGCTNEPELKTTEGPCSIIATTTREPSAFNDELQNRCSFLPTDASPAATAKVLARQAEKAKRPWAKENRRLARRQQVWREFHSRLTALPVVIPFADEATLQAEDITARRLQPLLFMYVSLSALLHQGVREIVEQGGERFIVASLDDYANAFRLLTVNAPRPLAAVSEAARAAYETLRPKLATGGVLSTGEIQTHLRRPKQTCQRWLKELVDAGLLEQDGKFGRQNRYSMGVGDVSSGDQLGLVPPNQVAARWSSQRTTERVA